MKKAFILTVSFIVFFVLSISALNISEKMTFKKDDEYISSLLKTNIKEGMDFEDIYSFFKSHGRELEPYRECEKNEKGEMECEDFERIVTGLKLPGNNLWLGKGDAQIYMIIDKNKKLESFFYEIYYPRFH
jgi:uncharacterized membrane protein